MAFDYFLEVFFFNCLKISFMASFLNNNRLPHLGQVDRKDMYSVILDRFQLCEQVKHFINMFKIVGATGFEPATPCTPCTCATGLRHAPNI